MRSSFYSALLLVFIIGCDSSGHGGVPVLQCLKKPISGTLQPLEVGNRWDYENVRFDGIILSTYRHEVTEKLDTLSADGNPIFVISQFRIDESGRVHRNIWANTSHGLQRAGYISDDDTVIANVLTYPFPALSGERFNSYGYNTDSTSGELVSISGGEYEVVFTGHVTSVPIGDFETIVYEQKRFTMVDVLVGPYFHQFAPGIGLVARDGKRLASENGPRPSPQFRLIDYCLMQ